MTTTAPSTAAQPADTKIGAPIVPAPPHLPTPSPLPIRQNHFPVDTDPKAGDLVIGFFGPRVYLLTVTDDVVRILHKRWVPDPTTLFALDPRGWGVVQSVPNSELNLWPIGPNIPSRVDGLLYRGDTTPEVYVMQGLTKHHIPDPATLQAEFGGWADVVVIAQADMDAIPLGDPIPSVE